MMTFKAAKQACLAIVIVAGATPAKATTQPAEGLPMIARDVAALAAARPQEVRDAVLAGLNDCLPEEASAVLANAKIKELIVDLHLIYFKAAGQAGGGSDLQRQIDGIIDARDTELTAVERKDLEVVKSQALDHGLTLLCVAVTARGLLESRGVLPEQP